MIPTSQEDKVDPIELPESLDRARSPPIAPLVPTHATAEPVSELSAILGTKLSIEEKDVLITKLQPLLECFSPLNALPADVPPFAVQLTKGATPSRCYPRPQSPEKQAFVEAEIKHLLELNIIQPSTSPWASPIVVVTKRNRKFRLCVDYSRLCSTPPPRAEPAVPPLSPLPVAPVQLVPDADKATLAELVHALPHDQDGSILLLKDPPPPEILLRLFVLAHDHPLAGHMGVARTIHTLRSALVWKGMDAAIRELTRCCPRCQKLKDIPSTPSEMYSTRALALFQSLIIDHIGPLRDSAGYKYILTLIDRFSHLLVLIPTKDTTAETAAEAIFTHWICVHGVPEFITSDGGSSFTAATMQNLVQLLGAKHHISAAYHPEGHGSVERANRTIMQVIRALFKDQTTWHQLVNPAAFAINTAYSRVLGTTPFEVAHGFFPRLPIHSALGTSPNHELPEEPIEVAAHLVTATRALHERVVAVEAKVYEANRAEFLKKSKHRAIYDVGEHVLVRYPRTEKLLEAWRGPFQITAKENENIYEVEDLNSHDRQRIHINRLHVFYPGNLTHAQLCAEAVHQEEYLVERVDTHQVVDGEHWFYVKWVGYDQKPIDEEDCWVRYAHCRYSPVVKDYIAAHKLTPRRR
jgi:hypothetical protein